MDDVQDICNAPFGLLKETMENIKPAKNEFPVVKIPGFVNFYVKNSKQNKLHSRYIVKTEEDGRD